MAAQARREVDGHIAQTKAREAGHLAQWLVNDMATRGRAPPDYVILVKQKSNDFEADLVDAFAQRGLRLRNESHMLGRTTVQNLLTDIFAKIAIALLRLGSTRRAAAAWHLAVAALLQIHAIATDDRLSQRGQNGGTAHHTLTALRADMSNTRRPRPVRSYSPIGSLRFSI